MSGIYTGPIGFAKAIIATMKADAILNAAISASFPGKTLKYYIGIDDADLPTSDNCPHIAFVPGNYQARQMMNVSLAEKDISLTCALVISSDSKTTASNVTEYAGLALMEALVPLCVKSMKPKVLELGRFGKFGPITTEIAYPLYRAIWTVDAVDEYEN
jgi:hypothetical protein